MIPAGLQAFPSSEGASKLVSASMQGIGESLDQTFAQRLAHFQEKHGAFSEQQGLQSQHDTFGKRMPGMEALLETLPSLGDIDWEMAMIKAEQALSEDEGDVGSSFDLKKIAASLIDADPSIAEMLERLFPDSEALATETDEPIAFAGEMREADIPPLLALIAFVAEKGEHATPTREQLVHYVQQLYPAAGRESGSQNDRNVSGRVLEAGKTTDVAPPQLSVRPLTCGCKNGYHPSKVQSRDPASSCIRF